MIKQAAWLNSGRVRIPAAPEPAETFSSRVPAAAVAKRAGMPAVTRDNVAMPEEIEQMRHSVMLIAGCGCQVTMGIRLRQGLHQLPACG